MQCFLRRVSSLVFNLETSNLSDIDGLLCQEKIAKEELDHALHCEYLFWKERAKMLWFKDEDRNTAFSMLWLRGDSATQNFSVIRRLWIDNEVIEDSQFIEDHILDFYINLYAESVSND